MVRVPPPDFEVPYRAVDFPDHMLSCVGNLNFSADDLAHALFVTGRAPGDRWAYGNASVYEWLHRASLVPAYVERTSRAALIRSELALELDRSEAVMLSYVLGQAATGIFCRTKLSVPFLMHIDRYALRYNLRFGRTRKRSDLFGLAPNGWVVAEAKGRSRAMPYGLRRKMEEQKRSVDSISGESPWMALGCVASFPDFEAGMRVDAFDPVEDAEESISLSVSPDRFVLDYYLPFLRALDFGETQEENSSFVSAEFGSFGIRVSLPRVLHDRIRRAEDGETESLQSDVYDILNEVHSRELWLFLDGVSIETNWGY